MPDKRILIVDPDIGMRAVLQDILEDDGYEVRIATDGRSALSAIENEDFDLILTDFGGPKMNGMEFLDYIEQNRPDLKVVVITEYTGKANVNKAKFLGALEFLGKSVQIEELKRAVHYKDYFSMDPIPVLSGSTTQEGILTFNITSNPSEASSAALLLTIYFLKSPCEGYIYINENGVIALPMIEDSHIKEVNFTPPIPINKDWLLQGKNMIRFSHMGSFGYEIRSAMIRLYFGHDTDALTAMPVRKKDIS